jgi:undecaprenyl-diphosphatase
VTLAFSLAQFLQSVGNWGALIVFVLAAGESAAFFGFVFPGEIAVILGGVAAGTKSMPLSLAITAAVSGAIIGDSIGYWLGHNLGPRIAAGSRFKKATAHLDSATRIVGERGWWALVVARFTALLRALVPFAAGMGHMPYQRFLVGNVLGGVAWGTSFTVAGFVAGANYPTVEKWFRTGGLAVAGLAIVIGGIVWATRWISHHPERVRKRLTRLMAWKPLGSLVHWVGSTAPGRAATLVVTASATLAGLWVFAAIVQDVLGRDELFLADRSIIAYLQAHSIPWLVSVARSLNAMSSPTVVVAVAVAVGVGALVVRKPRLGWALGVSMLGQFTIVELAASIVDRSPPPTVALAQRTDYGFPSEHVAAFVGLTVVLAWPWVRRNWTRTVLGYGSVATLVALVASARVVLLVEFPSDVIAAAAVATGWALLSCAAFDRLVTRPDT